MNRSGNSPEFPLHGGSGIARRQLAEKQGIPEAERRFAAGLVHDTGKLLIYYKEPEPARAAEP